MIKEYKIRILLQSGSERCWIEETIKAKSFHVSTSGRYYYFQTEDERSLYYPVNCTIIEELKQTDNAE